MVVFVHIQSVCNVSDSEAGAILEIINVLVPIIENVLQLGCEKKNVIGSLNVVPVIGSIAFATGRLFTWATHVNVQNPIISVVRSEMRLIHDGAMAISNALVDLAPVRGLFVINHTCVVNLENVAQLQGRGNEYQGSY